MTHAAHCDCPARLACLTQATAFVAAFCAQHAIDPRDTLRLTLMVEELFTNTVVHGHRGDSDAAVHIELHADPTQLTLAYADTAPAFDPLAWLPQATAALAADLAARPVGKMGIALVVRTATHAHYERSGGRNRLRLVLDRQR